jgi:hypothetical protein
MLLLGGGLGIQSDLPMLSLCPACPVNGLLNLERDSEIWFDVAILLVPNDKSNIGGAAASSDKYHPTVSHYEIASSRQVSTIIMSPVGFEDCNMQRDDGIPLLFRKTPHPAKAFEQRPRLDAMDAMDATNTTLFSETDGLRLESMEQSGLKRTHSAGPFAAVDLNQRWDESPGKKAALVRCTTLARFSGKSRCLLPNFTQNSSLSVCQRNPNQRRKTSIETLQRSQRTKRRRSSPTQMQTTLIRSGTQSANFS